MLGIVYSIAVCLTTGIPTGVIAVRWVRLRLGTLGTPTQAAERSDTTSREYRYRWTVPRKPNEWW